jgi:hypothetical protein
MIVLLLVTFQDSQTRDTMGGTFVPKLLYRLLNRHKRPSGTGIDRPFSTNGSSLSFFFFSVLEKIPVCTGITGYNKYQSNKFEVSPKSIKLILTLSKISNAGRGISIHCMALNNSISARSKKYRLRKTLTFHL